MKKLISMLLAMVLVMGLVACGSTNKTNNNTTNGTEAPTTTAGTEAPTTGEPTEDILNEDVENQPTEPIETTPVAEPNAATVIYNAIWEKVPEDQRFPVMGGDFNAPVDGAPGNYALDNEGIANELYLPADQIAKVDAVSALRHAMLANNYTGAVYHVADAADANGFADAMKASLGSAQWICGQPEKMIIAVVNAEYVLVVFGINDAVNPTEAALTAAYPDATILYSEAIAG